jgi:cytochrome P450 family 142 subfamily A polypeptide 1
MRVMFDRLLDRLPDLHLVDDTEPTHRPANFISGYEGLKVAFTPSAPLAG